MRRPAGQFGWLHTICERCCLAVFVGLSVSSIAPVLRAQSSPVSGGGHHHRLVPEPILWKQSRFLIPYRWSAGSDHSAAQSVRLFISKDEGASWQPISEAEPNLRGFTYHAEQDGEFWFSIRTIDHLGRSWPAEPHRPELRVIVDTTMPSIHELGGTIDATGLLALYWRIADAHLNPSELKIELRADGTRQWLKMPIPPSQTDSTGTSVGRTTWQLPQGTHRVSIRAEAYDLAGNRSVRGAEVAAGVPPTPSAGPHSVINGRGALPVATVRDGHPHLRGPITRGPQVVGTDSPHIDPFAEQATVQPDLPAAQPRQPELRRSTPAGGSNALVPISPQPWPADVTTETARGVTSHHAPAHQSAGEIGFHRPGEIDSRPADGDKPSRPDEAGLAVESAVTLQDVDSSAVGGDTLIRRPFHAVAPYRSASFGGTADTAPSEANPYESEPSSGSAQRDATHAARRSDNVGNKGTNNEWRASGQEAWLAGFGLQLPPGTSIKMVAARAFDLDYALDSVGSWGVSRVELWGTRDGGQTWRSYALDDDNRSPMRVTVEGDGVYGFRIIAQGAGGPAAPHPLPGDQPELWVGVDQVRPQAELLSVQLGTGNLSDHLIFHWRAEDRNLDHRPIALFYSSQPVGPWSAVATGLENTGEYAWRLERHLPERFYLRLEVRDTAGNLASYQTSSPITLPHSQPQGHLRGVRPLGVSAGGR